MIYDPITVNLEEKTRIEKAREIVVALTSDAKFMKKIKGDKYGADKFLKDLSVKFMVDLEYSITQKQYDWLKKLEARQKSFADETTHANCRCVMEPLGKSLARLKR